MLFVNIQLTASTSVQQFKLTTVQACENKKGIFSKIGTHGVHSAMIKPQFFLHY
jgi:hypothetical protein